MKKFLGKFKVRPLTSLQALQMDTVDSQDHDTLIEQAILVIRLSVTMIDEKEAQITRETLEELLQKLKNLTHSKSTNYTKLSKSSTLVTFWFGFKNLDDINVCVCLFVSIKSFPLIKTSINLQTGKVRLLQNQK